MPPLPRRQFISAITLAGAAVALAPRAFAIGGGKPAKVKVGVIGCGGRGTGAIHDFTEAAKILGIAVEVTAVADAFASQAVGLGSKVGVPTERCFAGYDAYRKVIASGCEYVIMATPPAFRPVHLAAAIEAGKHCFVEKPVAVDPVGARSIIATGEKAKAKGLAIVAGTQRRHSAEYQRNKALIDAGAIGAIRGGVVQWNGTVPWTKRRNPGESDADYMARNWVNFTGMSGDHIVEQHVHNLDVAVWFLGRLPVSALGFGGRARRETGDQFDFFSVDLDFGDGVHIHSQCRQITGTTGRVGEFFTGADGTAFGGGKIAGKHVEVAPIKLESDNPYVQEHVDLIKGVIAGKPLNEARQVAESTAVAIMGRISAYTGEQVRWDDMMVNEQSPHYSLACQPAAIDFERGPVTLAPEVPAIPGKKG